MTEVQRNLAVAHKYKQHGKYMEAATCINQVASLHLKSNDYVNYLKYNQMHSDLLEQGFKKEYCCLVDKARFRESRLDYLASIAYLEKALSVLYRQYKLGRKQKRILRKISHTQREKSRVNQLFLQELEQIPKIEFFRRLERLEGLLKAKDEHAKELIQENLDASRRIQRLNNILSQKIELEPLKIRANELEAKFAIISRELDAKNKYNIVLQQDFKQEAEHSLELSKQIEEQKQIIEDLSKKNLMLELTKTKLKTKCQVKRKIIAELRTSCFENDSELNAQKQTIGKLTESNKRFKKKNKILRDDLNLYRTSHSKVSKKLFLISELEGYLSSHEHVDIKVIKEFLTDLEGI